jgi:hypothetical protein
VWKWHSKPEIVRGFTNSHTNANIHHNPLTIPNRQHNSLADSNGDPTITNID